MIPEFDEHGNLPVGIHECTFEEIVEHFGHGSAEREVEIDELRGFLQWAQAAGIERLIVNGSFTTAKVSPNDVDIVILAGAEYPNDQQPIGELELRFPFLQIIVAADENDLEQWATEDFGTDRLAQPKGVIEVLL